MNGTGSQWPHGFETFTRENQAAYLRTTRSRKQILELVRDSIGSDRDSTYLDKTELATVAVDLRVWDDENGGAE